MREKVSVNVEKNDSKPTIAAGLLPMSVFLACSLLLFEPAFFAFNSTSKSFQMVIFVGSPLLFSIMAVLIRWHRRFLAFWPAFCSFVIASIALFLMWLPDDFPRLWLGLDPKAPSGRAIIKVSDAAILLLTVVVLGKLLRIDFDSIYLRKGSRPVLGLAV
jgi:hypothetical protein